MRDTLRLLVLCMAAAACRGDAAAPRPRPEPAGEIPRGDYHLLVEHYTRSGERSFYTMTPGGDLVAPFDAIPRDARRVYPSPDGRTIAYIRETEDDLLHLWLMDRDGGHRRPLLEGERLVEAVAWAPDGRRLMLESSTMEEPSDLWVIHADGSGLRDLTPDPKPALMYDREPAWSPDGTRIAFASSRSGGTRLWIMDADGNNMRQVIGTAGREASPVWSTDGRLIAFAASGPGGAGIGIVQPDGSGFRLFPVAGDAGQPAWLPDGRLLYSTNVTGDYELYALDVSSGISENLTNHRDHDLRAAVFRYVPPTPWLGLAAPARYATDRAGSPGIAVGDVDDDGRADVVVLAPSAAELRLLRGAAGGVLQPFGSLTAAADQRALVVANVSMHPAPDIVMLGSSGFSVWRGGDGGQGAATAYELPGDARGMTLADFDRNGRMDIAALVDRPGSGFHVLVHAVQPDDAIIPVLHIATSFTGAGRACAADVTGEGAPDLVVLTANTAASVVFLAGHGDITFEPPVVAASGLAFDGESIPVCADLDGDRRADLALLRPGRARGLTILRSSGDHFAPPVAIDVEGSAIAAADLDRDGDLDVIVASPARQGLNFLRNLGDGRFAPPASIALGSAPTQLAVADIDGDGWPDVVTIDAAGSVAVTLNRGRSAT